MMTNINSLNINSHRTKRASLIDRLKCTKADIVCMQETQVAAHQIRLLCFLHEIWVSHTGQGCFEVEKDGKYWFLQVEVSFDSQKRVCNPLRL